MLQEISRLQGEDRRRNRALAVAAHDIKAPLAIITGYLKLLATEKMGTLTAGQRDILENMQASCVRLQHIISEFLTYGVLGADSRLPTFENGDLNDCIEEVYREWIGPYEANGVCLTFSRNEQLPPITFEFRKLQQVIASLLDNALKFTPNGKSVTITVEPHFWERRCLPGAPHEERRKCSNTAPNSVLIAVTDTGPGIAPEYQQEVFEEFYSRKSGETRPGTGLGLAIARQVVQAHGGKIWVESAVGFGSKFCVVLPLRPPVYTAMEPTAPAASPGAGGECQTPH